MRKTLQKVTKDPKRVEAVRKGRENYMNKLKESILNDAKKLGKIPAMQPMRLLALPTPPPRDQVILTSMALAYLPSLL